MEQKQIEIKKLSLTELKEVGFQLYQQLDRLAIETEQTRKGLVEVTKEVANRPAQPTATVEVPVEVITDNEEKES